MELESDQTGNDQPKDVIADYVGHVQDLEIAAYQKKMKKARNALFIAGALLFLGEVIPMLKNGGDLDATVVVIALLLSSVFIALGFWTRKRPYTAILVGLIAFIGYISLVVITNGITDGSDGVVKALLSGIIIKIILLANLIASLKEARALRMSMDRRVK